MRLYFRVHVVKRTSCGHWSRPLMRDRIHHRVELHLGGGSVSVTDVQADHAREREAFRRHVAGHDVGSLRLRVLIAVVGNDGNVEEVGGIVGGIGQVLSLSSNQVSLMPFWAWPEYSMVSVKPAPGATAAKYVP